MKTKTRKDLSKLDNIGKRVIFSGKFRGTVVDEVSSMSNNPNYRHFYQKIRRKDGSISFRHCFYTFNDEKARIVFARRPPEVPFKTECELLMKANQRDWFK